MYIPECLRARVFFPLVLMAPSGCCCWSKGTPSTIAVDLEIEMMLVCFKHSQKDSSESSSLQPVLAFKWKRQQTQAPGNPPDIKIDITVVLLKRPNGFSLTAAALFIPSWMKNCVWHLLLLLDKTSISVHLRWNPPPRHGDADVFLLWLLHTSHLNVPTPPWNGLRLIWSPSSLIMQPALTFSLWRLCFGAFL